jgi:hypothetical protein
MAAGGALMLKWIVAVRRKDGVSHEELVDVWEHIHVPHVRELAKPVRYLVTFFDPDQPDVDCDGMAELTFRDEAHFDDTVGRKAGPNRNADGFSRYVSGLPIQLITDERINVDAETTRDDLKISYFARRRSGVSVEAFHEHWLGVHLPNVKAAVERTPSAVRYVVNLSRSDSQSSFDGMAAIWFRDPAATFLDLGLTDDGFLDLVGDSLTVRGHELVVVG